MADPTCYASLEACAIRVAKLTATGAPSAGATMGLVSDALISLGVSVELKKGADLEQKNGCGAICAAFKEPDTVKRLNLALELCQFDIRLIEFLTGGDLFSSGGYPVGWQFPSVTAAAPNGVSLEVWTKAWDGSEQATPTYTTPSAAYFHWVFPKTKWVLGNTKMDEGFMVVPVDGTSEENSLITANGPFNDWPAAIAAQGGITRVGGVFFDAVLPTSTCTPITVAAAS